MGKKTPDAPDYEAAAERTAESDKENLTTQTWANRMNQYNPWGSIEYDNEQVRDPATGQMVTKWTQNQELTPLAQEALDRQMAIDNRKSDFASKLMGRAGNALLTDTDYSKFQGFAEAPTPYGMRKVPNPVAEEQPVQQQPVQQPVIKQQPDNRPPPIQQPQPQEPVAQQPTPPMPPMQQPRNPIDRRGWKENQGAGKGKNNLSSLLETLRA
jgi:hypothetical protein